MVLVSFLINTDMADINVIVVETGNYANRGEKYVKVLQDMVWRNTSKTVNFYCLSDTNHQIDNVKTIKVDNPTCSWWDKLKVFDLFRCGKNVFIDLDVVITDDLDPIFDIDSEFSILQDFYYYDMSNSSVMLWVGDYSNIYKDWINKGQPLLNGGDQEWIHQWLDRNQISYTHIQKQVPNGVKSYKADFIVENLDPNASIVVFHGKPKPHECKGWPQHFWKVGGLTKPRWKGGVNVSEDVIEEQILHALSLNLPQIDEFKEEHDKKLCIVGGGPSLTHTLDELQEDKATGAEVWSLNNTHNYLIDNHITPNVHLLLDARPENARFVENPNRNTTYFVASQCHPSVFNNLLKNNSKIVLWHGIHPILDKKDQPIQVAWGRTVGLKSLWIAYALGYRDITLYGFDSSYSSKSHHAYGQTINDNELLGTVRAAGRDFISSPWMMRQAEQYLEALPTMFGYGMDIKVKGDGLIPWVHRVSTENLDK